MPSARPHIEKHFTAGNFVRDVVIGMSDGLTVPFALAAGLSGAVQNTRLIVVGGLAQIAAGSIAMGLGGYLAAHGDAEHYQQEKEREEREIVEIPEEEKAEVARVFQAYGITEPYLAPQGPSAALSTKGTCLNAVGVERSRQLVNECLQVSPATHPPCNAQNACSMIVDEIKRGCALIGQGAPGFCAEYR